MQTWISKYWLLHTGSANAAGTGEGVHAAYAHPLEFRELISRKDDRQKYFNLMEGHRAPNSPVVYTADYEASKAKLCARTHRALCLPG